jgi:hypothetical protein
MSSILSLECTELNHAEDDWTEAGIFIERGPEESDPEMRDQVLLMTPSEMAALYQRMKLYYEQGIWSTGVV